jgi:hypothetical protein
MVITVRNTCGREKPSKDKKTLPQTTKSEQNNSVGSLHAKRGQQKEPPKKNSIGIGGKSVRSPRVQAPQQRASPWGKELCQHAIFHSGTESLSSPFQGMKIVTSTWKSMTSMRVFLWNSDIPKIR